eukprot:356990-Chlamydomonas_euryale.AAC.4
MAAAFAARRRDVPFAGRGRARDPRGGTCREPHSTDGCKWRCAPAARWCRGRGAARRASTASRTTRAHAARRGDRAAASWRRAAPR